MWTPEYYIRTVNLPRSVDGVVIPNPDGTFDIYLNRNQPEEVRRRWLEHEVRHIMCDHFYREADVAAKEREAEGLPPDPNCAPVPPGAMLRFSSPEAMLSYYRNTPGAMVRDYSSQLERHAQAVRKE